MALNHRSSLHLESLEPRIVLNVGTFGLVPQGFSLNNYTLEAEPDTTYVFDVGLEAEAFQFDGTITAFTLDFSLTSSGLRVSNYIDWDSGFDAPIDTALDTDLDDDMVSFGSFSGASATSGNSVDLGSFSVTTPSTAGELTLSLGGGNTTFISNFGTTTGMTFNDITFDVVAVVIPNEDYGDAPDTFDTTDLNGGPNHTIVPGNFLGLGVDQDDDGQPNFNANGDDLDADGDDEDGVIFNSPLVAGLLAEITVTASQAGMLDFWIDYNGNGMFDDPALPGDPDEYVPGIFPIALNPGMNPINFFVPNVIDADISYARFRFSVAGGLGPSGPADDGEVEDYQVQLFPLAPDFGDAPDPYPTLLADDGAVHLASIDDFFLGEKIDFESDGFPDEDALGDDEDDGLDFPSNEDPDEDGITFTDLLVPGTNASIDVLADVPSVIEIGVGAKLDAWIDWNADGDWDDTGEQIFTNELIVDGNNTLQFAVPASAITGQTFARFRLSSEGDLDPDGVSNSGEIEDYLVSVAASPVYDIDPDEQEFIYLLNMARSDPEGFALAEGYSISFAGIDPQPPLAVNPYLAASALFHATEMAENDYFGHTSQVTGDQPNQMALDAGYPLPYSAAANNIESIAAGYGLSTAPDSGADALQLLL
ncbi:MAG: hypothetical protein GY869_07460, partial [Planctomycetes bacterium]|nr:hypothetical protein [Planctomycetota bacterium]